MTTTPLSIAVLSDYAQLAQAAYGYFDKITDEYPFTKALTDTDYQAKFSTTQAALFTDRYALSYHCPNDTVGFSATLFKDKTTGQFILSCRGTEPTAQGGLDLFDADVSQIANPAIGCAVEQMVSLYNLMARLNAPEGASVIQYSVNWGNSFGSRVFAGLTSSALANGGLGVLSGPNGTVLPIEVTGHSLGGGLAQATTLLFPNQVTQCATFNSAGFQLASGAWDALYTDLTGNKLPPQTSSICNKITNAYADVGLEVITSASLLTQYGTRVPYTIGLPRVTGSPGTLVDEHGMADSSSALRVMALLQGLDVPTANAVFCASATDITARPSTLLSLLCQATGIPCATPPLSREQLYATANQLEPVLNASTITSLLGYSADQLYSLAATSDAVRRALVAGSPLTLVPKNGASPSFPSIPQTDTLSTDYWHDRANYVALKFKFNADEKIAEAATHSDFTDGIAPAVFNDHRTNTHLELQPSQAGSATNLVIFGSDGVDTLQGGAGGDHLYGGYGANFLQGGAGDDLLVSGGGCNRLIGGAGTDKYYAESGDTITDDGPLGIIYFKGQQLVGGTWDAVKQAFISTDKLFEYRVTGSNTVQVTYVDGTAPAGAPADSITLSGLTLTAADANGAQATTQLWQGIRLEDTLMLPNAKHPDIVARFSVTMPSYQLYDSQAYGLSCEWSNNPNLMSVPDNYNLVLDVLPTDVSVNSYYYQPSPNVLTPSEVPHLAINLTVKGRANFIQMNDAGTATGAQRVSTITFAEGTVWGLADLLPKADTFVPIVGQTVSVGALAADATLGTASHPIVGPGIDNVYAVGQLNRDVTLGYFSGNDLSRDRITLTDGLTADQVLARQNNDDLVLLVKATGHRITVNHYFSGDGATANLTFADGTTWTAGDTAQHVLPSTTALSATSTVNDLWQALALKDSAAGLSVDLSGLESQLDALYASAPGAARNLVVAAGGLVKTLANNGLADYAVFREHYLSLSHDLGWALDVPAGVSDYGNWALWAGRSPWNAYSASHLPDGNIVAQQCASNDWTAPYVMYGGSGNDRLQGDWAYSNVHWVGGSGDNVLDGSGVQSGSFDGSAGNDLLIGARPQISTGAAQFSFFDGHGGCDHYVGGFRNNTYFLAAHWGKVAIDISQVVDNSHDRVLFDADIDPSALTYTAQGRDLVLSSGTSDVLLVQGYFDPANAGKRPPGLHFNAGDLTLSADDLAQLPNTGSDYAFAQQAADGGQTLTGWVGESNLLRGGAGDDTLVSLGSNDRLVAGTGKDRLIGHDSSTVFQVGRGAGQVTIDAASQGGTLALAGYALADVTFVRHGADLLLQGTQDGLSVRVEHYYAPAGGTALTQIRFDATGAPTVTLGATDIVAQAQTLVYNRGDGTSTVSEWKAAGAARNSLAFGTGITASDLAFTRVNADLLIQVGSGADCLTVQGYFAAAQDSFAALTFADGTTLDPNNLPVTCLIGQNEAMVSEDFYQPGQVRSFKVDPGVNGGPSGTPQVQHDLLGNLQVTNTYGDGWHCSTRTLLTATHVSDAILASMSFTNNGTTETGAALLANVVRMTTDATAAPSQTLVFNRGDGANTVNEWKAAGSVQNTLAFGAGITANDLAFTRVNTNDLRITVANSADSLYFQGYCYSLQDQLASLQFADGTSQGEALLANGTVVTAWRNDGQGCTTTFTYVASGARTGDSWLRTDGSHGTDTLNANGSTSGLRYAADGTLAGDSVLQADGSSTGHAYLAAGAVDTWSKDGQGNGTDSTDDGHGNTEHRNTNADGSFWEYGSKADGSSSSAYRQADGSYGSSAYNAQWVGHSEGYAADGTLTTENLRNADGSSSGFSDDQQGDTSSYSGDALGNSTYVFANADGSHGDMTRQANGYGRNESFAANGVLTQQSTNLPDGSYASFYDDQRGDTGSSSGDALGNSSSTWANADGSHGTSQGSADGTYRSASVQANGTRDTSEYRADGSRTQSEFKADGSGVSDTYAANGQLTAEQTVQADGSEHDWQRNPNGSTQTTDVFAGFRLAQDFAPTGTRTDWTAGISALNGTETLSHDANSAIDWATPDTVQWGTVFVDDVLTAARTGNDLRVSDKEGGAVELAGWFSGSNHSVLQTPDGSQWTQATVTAQLAASNGNPFKLFG